MKNKTFYALAIALAIATGISATVTHLDRMGADYVRDRMIAKEWQVLDHAAPSPWCYRPLMPIVGRWLDQHVETIPHNCLDVGRL